MQLNLFDELIIDSFAGGGGASTGIELALGRPVDIAINHDKDAIAMHMKNHPYTKHYCESVFDVNPRAACNGRGVALAWFSPDCKHFSKAKGGKPVSKKIRGLAWITLRWAGTVRPRVIILENVEEFVTWGPVRKGKPIKSKKGETFRKFVSQLEALGYVVEWRELKACDYGTPTIRKRFFLVARCDGRPAVWPTPTHGNPVSEAVKSGRLLPWKTAADCIDFSLPCKSIFNRSKPLAENTLRRIARGTDKFVIKNKEPFIINYKYQNQPESVNAPLSTITAVGSHYLVQPAFGVMVNHSANKEHSGFPLNVPIKTQTAKNGKGIIMPVMNAIGQTGFSTDRSYSVSEPVRTVVGKAEQCIIVPSLIQYHSETTASEVRGKSAVEPMLTVDTQPRYALNVAHLAEYFGNAQDGLALTAPLHTVTAKDREAFIESHLCILRNNMGCKPMDEPVPTITTSAGHFAEIRTYLHRIEPGADLGNWYLIREMLNKYCGCGIAGDEVLIIELAGVGYFISDIGLRMLEPKELYAAQGVPADYIIDFEVDGKKYSKAAQVARCGNMVCPPLAKALVKANLPELCGDNISTMAELNERIAI